MTVFSDTYPQEDIMPKPNIKYRVTLTAEERDTLKKLIPKGHTAGYRIRRTDIACPG
jgi:hypothetical protein